MKSWHILRILREINIRKVFLIVTKNIHQKLLTAENTSFIFGLPLKWFFFGFLVEQRTVASKSDKRGKSALYSYERRICMISRQTCQGQTFGPKYWHIQQRAEHCRISQKNLYIQGTLKSNQYRENSFPFSKTTDLKGKGIIISAGVTWVS